MLLFLLLFVKLFCTFFDNTRKAPLDAVFGRSSLQGLSQKLHHCGASLWIWWCHTPQNNVLIWQLKSSYCGYIVCIGLSSIAHKSASMRSSCVMSHIVSHSSHVCLHHSTQTICLHDDWIFCIHISFPIPMQLSQCSLMYDTMLLIISSISTK